MRPVALLLRSYHPPTAVGSDVDGMRDALGDLGAEVVVFAQKTTHAAARPVAEFPGFAARHRPLTIYHHAIAWPRGVRAFRRAPGRRVLRHHNVTPARHFVGHSLEYVAGAALGRLQTRALARDRGIDLFLSASRYSTGDLLRFGAPPARCAEVAPFDRSGQPVEPDQDRVDLLSDGCVNLLSVGRLLPHKRQHRLFGLVEAWRARFVEPVRLTIVGSPDRRLKRYAERLRRGASRLANVELAGELTREALEAYFTTASALVVTSAHEGFCLPILEAMRRGVPVVAVGDAAVPETAGGAALLLENADPGALAAAAHAATTDGPTRAHLIAAGRRRASDVYGAESQRKRFIELVEPLLS